MDQQLEALTRKLYDEGIHKAETEARQLLDNARQDARQILDRADEEARAIREKARTDAEDLTRRANSELRLTSRQVLSTVRHTLESFLHAEALAGPVRQALREPDSLVDLIRLVIQRMEPGGDGEPTILLSAEDASLVEDRLRQSLHQVLGREPLIQPWPGIRAGFRIRAHDGAYQLSFTDDDFIAFLMPYLSREVQQIIHPDHDAN